jgi:hypothetical protein
MEYTWFVYMLQVFGETQIVISNKLQEGTLLAVARTPQEARKMLWDRVIQDVPQEY